MKKKLIEVYQDKEKEYADLLLDGENSLTKIADLQEIKYRISVLSTLRMFIDSAPITDNMKEIKFHFGITSRVVDMLLEERRFGRTVDENGQKRRDTAEAALKNVVRQNKKRFESFKPEKVSTYAKLMQEYISTVLPVWVQYRDTYIAVAV